MAPTQLHTRSELSFGAVFGITVGAIAALPFVLLFIMMCSWICKFVSLDYRFRRRRAQDVIQARLNSRRQPQLDQIEMVASMPHLPDEIMLAILSHVQGGQRRIGKFCRAQRDLADISLTCKLWHRIITQVLYRRPAIHSADSLTRLARTVSQNTDLASMVKDLVLLCPKPKYSFQDPPGMSPSAMECIVSCTQLNSLTLGNQINKASTFISPRADSKFYKKLVTGYLSTLIITDSPAPLANTTSGVLRLPVLEELLFRRVTFPLSYSFPILPKLRTLSIIRCKIIIEKESPQFLDISATLLPLLRSLHVHEANFAIRLSPELLRGLEDLTYMSFWGDHQEAFFQTNSAIWGNTCNLRCMTTVALCNRFFPSLADLLPTLEKLTIIVPARDFTTCGWAEYSNGLITVLTRLLKAGRMKSLKEAMVVLGRHFDPSIIYTEESSPIPALIRQCAFRGVVLKIWRILAYGNGSQMWENVLRENMR